MILEEEVEMLSRSAPSQLQVLKYAVKGRYIAVQLSSGACGLAYYPRDTAQQHPHMSDHDALSSAKLALSEDLGEKSLGIAVVNALSTAFYTELRVKLGNPLNLISVEGRVVAMVGYFQPLLRRFYKAKELRIVERKSIEGVYPPSRAEEALKGASIVLITGSSLVYGGMEEYLRYSGGAETVIVMGPTSSMLPEPFFKKGAHIVAGFRVTDCNSLFGLDEISRDSLFTYGEKMYLVCNSLEQ